MSADSPLPVCNCAACEAKRKGEPPPAAVFQSPLAAMFGQPSEPLPRRVEVALQVAGLFRASSALERKNSGEFDNERELHPYEERCYTAALNTLTKYLGD